MAQSVGFVFFELILAVRVQPLNRNPLRQVLLDSIDFDALSPTTCPIKLYLRATNVRTGKIKVFDNSEIGVDAALASLVSFLFQPWRSTARLTGTVLRRQPADVPVIYNSRAATSSSCNSARCGGRNCRTALWRSSIVVNEISFNSSLEEAAPVPTVSAPAAAPRLRHQAKERNIVHSVRRERFR